MLAHLVFAGLPLSVFRSQELNIPEGDVEQLLVSLILDNRVHGHIDQVNQLLELGDKSVLYPCSTTLLHSTLALH